MSEKSQHPSASLQVAFGGYSTAGPKSINQDAFAAYLPTDVDACLYKGAVACIADGISGSTHSQIAAQTACRSFINDYYSTPDFWPVKQAASRVLAAINAWLHQQDRNTLEEGGMTSLNGHISTFSAAVIKSHTAHLFHVGDSRIYHFGDGRLELLTQDHSYQQSRLQHHLVRALGLMESVDIEYRTVPVGIGDRLLLCTDGVHDSLSATQLVQLMQSTQHNLEELALRIVEAARAADACDNASALLVEVLAQPEPQEDEVFRDISEKRIPPVLRTGDCIDDFKIIRSLATGSRSHVYLARSSVDEQIYVLKMPSKSMARDREYLEGFVREQWVGLRLRDPRLMKIYTSPKHSEYLYHVCEYIEGVTLKQWMTDNGCQSIVVARQMLAEMIKPVRALHRNGMLHRDLKPENFIINPDGILKLIDFGTVQAASLQELGLVGKEGVPVGDIDYVAPEYLVFGYGSKRSDIFSLACIVYKMISMELPYAAILDNRDFPRQFYRWQYRSLSASRHIKHSPPQWVDRVLSKALAPNPKFRYARLSEFSADLQSPSEEILRDLKHVPLIERNPLQFWKGLSLVLFLIVMAEMFYLLR